MKARGSFIFCVARRALLLWVKRDIAIIIIILKICFENDTVLYTPYRPHLLIYY